MPSQAQWERLFSPAAILKQLRLPAACRVAVEFGCGYGTFALAAAQFIEGTVYTFDIEPDMVATVQRRARALGLGNLRVAQRDLLEQGTGLETASADYAMVFHILHHDEPDAILREANRLLRNGGTLAILHWNCDETTPRGPPMGMRPTPAQCLQWALDAGFTAAGATIDLPPYHFGLVLKKGDYDVSTRTPA